MINWRDYLVLLWGALAICLALAIATFFLIGPTNADEMKPMPCAAYCTAWELQLEGEEIYTGPADMTEAECDDYGEDIGFQVPPTADLRCVEIPVARQDL